MLFLPGSQERNKPRKEIIITSPEYKAISNGSTVYATNEEITNFILSVGESRVLTYFYIPESYILENPSMVDKSLYLQSHNVSEEFILKALSIEYLLEEDLVELSLTTLGKLSKFFIECYSELIDWRKMMLYLSCDESVNIEDYLPIIEKANLWSIISASPLSIDFIRDHKNQLDWKVLAITQNFEPEELMEFEDYFPKETTNNFSTFSKKNIDCNAEDLQTIRVDIESVKSNGVFAFEEDIDSVKSL